MQRLKLLLASVAHFCVDSYATMLAPLLPLVMTRLGLGIAGAGFLGTLVTLCSITQPLLGLWGDRMHRRRLVLGGLAMTAVFTPLMGIAPSYWVPRGDPLARRPRGRRLPSRRRSPWPASCAGPAAASAWPCSSSAAPSDSG